MQGSQDKTLEKGTEVEAMGECYLLPCCPGIAQLAFLRNSISIQGWHPSQWAVSLISNQRKRKQTRLLQIWWRNFLSWGFLFPEDFNWCYWQKTKQRSKLMNERHCILSSNSAPFPPQCYFHESRRLIVKYHPFYEYARLYEYSRKWGFK